MSLSNDLNSVAIKVKSLQEKALELLIVIVKEDSEKGYFEDENRELLFQSLDTELNSLGFYTEFTKRKKKQEGKFIKDEIILFNDGDLWSNIVTDVVDTSLVFINTDSDKEKLKKVVSRFGTKLFGLSIPQQNKYIEEYLKPRLLIKIKEYLS